MFTPFLSKYLPFRRIISFSLITALLFPDIARCMENEDEKTNIVVPFTPSNSPEKKDEKGDNSDSDNSDLSPQKSPRSNENSSEELTLPTTINLIQKHKKSTDSNSPTSSDEQLTHSLTPSPEKNLGNFIPTSITSTLVLPESKEETKKEPIIDPKTPPNNTESQKTEQPNSAITVNEKTPLLTHQKAMVPQKKPHFPFEKENQNKDTEELQVIHTGSINNGGSKFLNFEEEGDTTDHKGFDGKENNDSGSTDNFLFLDENLELKAKKTCCCNRPWWPHPDLYQRKGSDLQNVIESSENDELKETKTFKEKKESKLPLILLSDEEQKRPPSFFIEELKKLDFSQLSHHAKAQLAYVIREIEEQWTKLDWIGAGIGAGVGGWLAPAMVPVYQSAGDYLILNFILFNEKPWRNIINFVTIASTPYIIPSIVLDGVPRNVGLWRKALTLLKEEDVSKKRIVLTALASVFPSLFEPFYLILLELELIKLANSVGWNSSPYKKAIFQYTWPLFMDSWASNFQTTWDLWDELQEWRHSTHIPLFRYTQIPSEEEVSRRDFKKKLDKVSKWLYRTASKEDIETLYKTIKNSKQEAQQQFENLEETDLPNAQAFLAMNTLLALGDDLERIQHYMKSWYDIVADIITDACLVTGSPARLLTLQLIISSITDLIPMPSWLRQALNWGLAGVGWIPQTGLEYQGMNAFFKEFLAQEEPDSEAIYKNAKTIGGFRVGGKTYAFFQALVFTLPLVVTVFQVTTNWKMDPQWMIGASTFVFAEFAAQASKQWNWSIQKWISFFSKLHNKVTRKQCLKSPLRTEYQRSYLLDLIQNLKHRLPYLSAELLQILQGNIIFKNTLEKEENE